MADFDKVEQISRFTRSHYGERVVDANTSPTRFAKIKTIIDESMELLNKTIDTSGANKSLLDRHIMHAKVKIIKSYLKLPFLENYSDELDSDDAVNLLNQVSSIIGDVDEEAEKHAWKVKLDDMSRRAEQSEKFVAYYERITNVLKKADCDEATKTWLTDDKFINSLSPSEKDFITVHGQSSSDVQAKAALLDERKQHVYKVAVKAVMEDERIIRLEQSQAEILTQMKVIADKVCNPTPPPVMHGSNKSDDMMEQLLMQNAAIINCMQVQQGGLGSYRGSNRGRGGSFRGGSSRGSSFRGGRGGRPYRSGPQCYHCGRHGHDENVCRIKHSKTFTCMKCGEAGHSQFSPKFHPISKN